MNALYEGDVDADEWIAEMQALRRDVSSRLVEVLDHYDRVRPAAEAVDALLADYAPVDAKTAEVPALRVSAEGDSLVFAREPGDRQEAVVFDKERGHWWWDGERSAPEQPHEQLVWALLRLVPWGDEEELERHASLVRFLGDQPSEEGMAQLAENLKSMLGPDYELEVAGREVWVMDGGHPVVQFRPEHGKVTADVYVDFEGEARRYAEQECRIEAEALLDSAVDRQWGEGGFEFAGGDVDFVRYEDGSEGPVYRGWMARPVSSIEEVAEAVRFAVKAERELEIAE